MTIRDEERAEDHRYWQTERRNLLRAYGPQATAEAEESWLEDLLSLDCIEDGSHHFPGWHATSATPVFRFQLSWGGPGDQWELACQRTRGGWALQRAAYVFLPWFGSQTHYIHQGSQVWQALQNLLESTEIEHDGDMIRTAYEYDI